MAHTHLRHRHPIDAQGAPPRADRGIEALRSSPRQRLRRLIGAISLAMLPITLYYFSPVVPLMGLASGVVSGALMVFTFLAVTAAVIGRAFCGFVCPVGALQDLARPRHPVSRRSTRRLAVVRLILFGMWIATMGVIVARVGLPREVAFTFQTRYGVSVTDIHGAIVLAGVLIVFAVSALALGPRGGCRSICWIAPFMQAGHAVGRTIGIRRLSLVPDALRGCSHCDVCSTVCPMGLAPHTVAEANLRGRRLYDCSECISCARCADACPASRLRFSRHRSGRSGAVHRAVGAPSPDTRPAAEPIEPHNARLRRPRSRPGCA
ncbi:MAG: 4Fe-4S binding protein [Spirochaetales bacterium]|nr:4Fe-4S binding protein [Spirochaetales bacterium]